MKLEYNWGRDDLRNYLKEKRKKFNIVVFILSIIIYISFMKGSIGSNLYDNKVILLFALFYISFILMLLYITTEIYIFINLKRNDKKTNNAYGIYKIELTDNDIIVTINDQEIKYIFKDISKLKIYKDSFFIRTKEDMIGLKFNKNLFKDNEYNSLLQFIKERVNIM